MFGKSFVKIKHGNQYTIEDLDHIMKSYGCIRKQDELTDEFLQKGVISYYDELHCYCVIFTGCIFEKRSAILSTIVIDEIIMLW